MLAQSYDFIFKPAREFCEKFQKKLGSHIFKVKICVNLICPSSVRRPRRYVILYYLGEPDGVGL